jgi:GMP synthase (glutamine-hydrolysing)
VAERVAVLRHDSVDHFGVGEEVLTAEGLEVEYVECWRGRPTPRARDYDAFVILGGEMNADETGRYSFLLDERELIRECVAESVPTLGICLGGQLMARAFNAPVSAGDSRESAFLPIRPTPAAREDPLLCVYRDGDRVFRWHEDAFAVPNGAVLLLEGGPVAPNQGFRVGERSWGVQFHPEVTVELVESWLTMVGDDLEREWGRTSAELRADIAAHLPAQQARSRELFRRFAEIVRSS